MIRIEKKSEKKLVPNLLPCVVRHNGPIPVSNRHWKPESEVDGSKTAYFRGRKLRGKVSELPSGYEGLLLEKAVEDVAARRLPDPRLMEEQISGHDSEASDQPQLVMKQIARFDQAIVWEHDRLPEGDNALAKGIEEWIAFAEAMHTSGG